MASHTEGIWRLVTKTKRNQGFMNEEKETINEMIADSEIRGNLKCLGLGHVVKHHIY